MAELTMTVQDFLDIPSCSYTVEGIEELFAGREALTALDILELDIPDEDKLWAVLREMLIPARTLYLLAVEFARAALLKEREAGREPDERCWRALEVKLAWLDGKASDAELDIAGTASRDVGSYAARAAAWAAARTAARIVAMDVAWAADRAAPTAYSAQVDIVRRMLRGER